LAYELVPELSIPGEHQGRNRRIRLHGYDNQAAVRLKKGVIVERRVALSADEIPRYLRV